MISVVNAPVLFLPVRATMDAVVTAHELLRNVLSNSQVTLSEFMAVVGRPWKGNQLQEMIQFLYASLCLVSHKHTILTRWISFDGSISRNTDIKIGDSALQVFATAYRFDRTLSRLEAVETILQRTRDAMQKMEKSKGSMSLQALDLKKAYDRLLQVPRLYHQCYDETCSLAALTGRKAASLI
jgi:hypothetical protein